MCLFLKELPFYVLHHSEQDKNKGLNRLAVHPWSHCKGSWRSLKFSCFILYFIDLAVFLSLTYPVFHWLFVRNTNSCSICHICLIEGRNLKFVRMIYRETCEFRLRVKSEPSSCFLPLWKIIFHQDRKKIVSLLTYFLPLWKKIFQWEKK